MLLSVMGWYLYNCLMKKVCPIASVVTNKVPLADYFQVILTEWRIGHLFYWVREMGKELSGYREWMRMGF
jgi:hypothetical protein